MELTQTHIIREGEHLSFTVKHFLQVFLLAVQSAPESNERRETRCPFVNGGELTEGVKEAQGAFSVYYCWLLVSSSPSKRDEANSLNNREFFTLE